MKLTALIALAAAREIEDARVPNKPNLTSRDHDYPIIEIIECGGSITSSDTVITSPGFDDPGNYYNNLNCVWTIDIPGATAITIIPEHFEIEPQEFCNYDRLTIVDSSGNDSIFCGSSSGRKRRSDSDDKPDNAPRRHDSIPLWSNFVTTNGARIEFTTNWRFTMKGFKLRIVSGTDYSEDSCVQILEGSGVVTSRNFPSAYGSGFRCYYTLQAEEGKIIKIRFTHFDVKPYECYTDGLVIDGTTYCGSESHYLAPEREMIIQSDRTVIIFYSELSHNPKTHRGFRFEWESVDNIQKPAVFWAHMQEFYELTKAQMENGENIRPWQVPFFTRMFNRVVSRGRIEDYSRQANTGFCYWRGQRPSYKEVEIKFFDENQNRCMNLIRMAEMGLQYIDSYVCMEGHSKPKSTLKRWKMSMNKIRDLGRKFCGLDFWQEGPVSLPAGLTCPTPENTFQRSANRIVGGQDVDRATTWPWMVAVGRGSRPERYECGGSIISKNPSGQSDWILTAGHCCKKYSSIEVLVGSQYRPSPWYNSPPGEFSVTSTRVIIHPDFSGWADDGHNICLLEVPNLTDSQSPDCDNCWSPVCLPSEHAEPGRLCYVAGWGRTSSGGQASSGLKDVGVNIFSREQCIALDFRTEQIKETEFCAGVPDMDLDGITEGGKGSCYGDYGGPLVCQEGSTAVQYGVFSWTYGCGERNLPGVYAKLGGPLTDWIYATMNGNEE